jgi:hypothetical protein
VPGDAGASYTEGSAPEPINIFSGVELQPLAPQAPPAKASDDSKGGNSARPLGSTTPLAAGQQELLLNRLLAKHPRFFWYVAIAILGIIIGILLGRKL